MSKIKYSFNGYSSKLNKRNSNKGKWLFVISLVAIAVGLSLYFAPKHFDFLKEKPAESEGEFIITTETPAEEEAKKQAVTETTSQTTEKEKTCDVVPEVDDIEFEKSVSELESLIGKADYAGAKKFALEMLKKYGSATKDDMRYREIGNFLTKLNIKMLFEGIKQDNTQYYRVRNGDNLNNIAIRYNLPVMAIQKANKIRNARIFPGQKLAVYQGDWSIEVSKDARLLYVFDGDDLFALYDIGIGKEGRTPEGAFKITDKIENPDWYSPDGRIIEYGNKENVLGTHWLKLEAIDDMNADQIGYGIHGTWEDGSITRSLSNGCIRMLNDDVEELFTYIPRQTEVTIYKNSGNSNVASTTK